MKSTATKPKPKPKVKPRLDQSQLPREVDAFLRPEAVAVAIGISTDVLYAMRQRGEFPPPDITIGGKNPRWKVSTFNRWASTAKTIQGTKRDELEAD